MVQIDRRIHEQAVAIERVHFVKTDKKVNPKHVDPLLYLKGTKPVLVTAPHAVRYVKRKEIKPSAEYTGSIAYLLHQLGGCHTLAVTKLYGGDPVSDARCLYKDRVKDICTAQNIELVLELLGKPRTVEGDVVLKLSGSFPEGSRLSRWEQLIKEKDTVNVKLEETDLNPYSVTAFAGNKLGIPAVQVSIGRRFRAPRQNGKDFMRIMQVLLALVA